MTDAPAPDNFARCEPAKPDAREPTLEDRIRALERERDELARALGEAQVALQATQAALRTREHMFAAMVHDLRNPLGTIVMGASALLQGEPPSDPKALRVRTVAERIHRQADRMTRQISNLSDLAEIQAGQLAITRARHAPGAILAAVAELVEPIARERGIGFETAAAADLAAIDCDADRVAQALANLAGNAMKVTPRGGAIVVGACGGAPSVFYVRDRGSERAWTAPDDPAASLGMQIARGIVEAHGGRIWLDSEPQTGNTVYFSVAPPA